MGLYDETIGTLLVGIFFNTFLYGLVTYQFAAYYRTTFNDPPAVKYMVLFLFILDTFHSASATYMAWYFTVTNYNNPAVLTVVVWPYIKALGRIWRLTSSNILYGIVILLAIPSFILGLLCSIEAWIINVTSELPRLMPLASAWLSMQVITDTFITVTLVIIFSRSRTGFRKMDTALNRLIRGAIQTGLFAGIFSMGDLITFALLPNTNLYGMFAIPIGRIYTNTLLDSLLARQLLTAEAGSAANVSVVIDSLHWPPTESQAISTIQSTSDQPRVQGTAQEPHNRSSSEGTRAQLVSQEV